MHPIVIVNGVRIRIIKLALKVQQAVMGLKEPQSAEVKGLPPIRAETTTVCSIRIKIRS